MADILPTRSQADIMQRELESCLSSEYTPDSLPLLLHQVRTETENLCLKQEAETDYFRIFFFFEKFLNLNQFPFCIFTTVLHRQILSLGSDQISAHAEMEEILPPCQRY